MTLGAVYDLNGALSGWSEADRLYSANGQVIGWLRDGAVYSLSGDHVGWRERGQFRDAAGCVVAWTPEALGGPAKPRKPEPSRRPSLAIAPRRPSFSRRMARTPFPPHWSERTWESYLG